MSRLLLLDDDPAVLNWLVVVLAQTGEHEVEAVRDSTKAFALVDSGRFDVVVLDVDMPEVTGLDVLRHVRRTSPGLEVVVITGVHDVSLAVEAMKLGAYDYLCKPVDAARLLQSIDRALERRRMREELRELHRRVTEVLPF